MGDQAHAPDPEDQRDAPCPAPGDHIERRGDGSPHAAQKVLHRLIGGGEPAGIIGRIADQHHRHQTGQNHQGRAQKFPAAPFDRRLHFLIHQGIPPSCLV